MKRRLKLPVSDQVFTDLLIHVRAELARQGFDAEADPEWETPIVDGCWAACLSFNPRHPSPNLKALAVKECVRRAVTHKQGLAKLRRGDEAGARRESLPPQHTGLGGDFPISDMDILSFVAANGRCRAARMLAMSPQQMRDLLDDIALRVRANLAT